MATSFHIPSCSTALSTSSELFLAVAVFSQALANSDLVHTPNYVQPPYVNVVGSRMKQAIVASNEDSGVSGYNIIKGEKLKITKKVRISC
jgi:hypothetical protein